MIPFKTYPLCDTPTSEETGGAPFRDRYHAGRSFFAVPTGEKRPPRRGEWYLSGAIVQAYRAPNDLSTPFHLAKLVRTRTTTITTVTTVEPIQHLRGA